MKNLLVNGCSFVAGDAIVWDKFVQENNQQDLVWGSLDYKNKETIKMVTEYKTNYRRKYNFPTMLANELAVDYIDLSEDGSSNDSIAITTILYILSLSEEDRKNFHVVVGWTSPTRIAKYCKTWNSSMNLHLNELKNIHQTDVHEEVKFHHEALINSHDEDYFSNYIKNVFLLENFLKANGITYTFYRNLGATAIYSKYKFESFFPSLRWLSVDVDINNFTNDNCWFRFIPSEHLGFASESLETVYLRNQPHNKISNSNGHPNLTIMTEISKRISDFIKEKNYLNVL